MLHKSGLWVSASILTASALCGNAGAASYTVTGTIRTSTAAGKTGSNRPVKRVKVDVYDEDYGPDDHVGTDYTDDAGAFSCSFDMYVEDPDVYATVTYQFQAPNGKYVYVRDLGSADTIIEEKVENVVDVDIPPGTHAFSQVLNLASNKANIGSEARTCLAWVWIHSVGWSVPRDLIGYARPNETGSNCPGHSINIQKSDYDNPGAGVFALSDIHHETGHFIHYCAYGNQWKVVFVSPHQVHQQTQEGNALGEGWAEYVAFKSASPDQKNQFTASAPRWWRGLSVAAPLNTGTDNAGDIVEGAVWRIWASIGDFAGTFKAFRDDDPTHLKAWLNGYGADKGWSIDSAFEACQANGVVYTRAKITGFAESAPPDYAPADDGNEKPIRDVTFLRGTVKPTVAQNTKIDLHLGANSSIIAAAKKRLGHKSATDGDGRMQSCAVGDWTFLADTAWASDIEFDTTTLADDDYDLIMRAENGHGWWDNFDPDFANDSEATRNSDEKWLKHLRTWYNQDADPSDDKEGKVIIDNAAPEVSNTKP